MKNNTLPPGALDHLTKASDAAWGSRRASSPILFTSSACGNDWDNFIADWAGRIYVLLYQALGPYHTEPKRHILPLEEGAHLSGANASFSPGDGQVRLCGSIVDGLPGITLEKITHEFLHASLAGFPEGDPFYEESFVDFSTFLIAHAPFWGIYRDAMIKAADQNIAYRRDRALQDLSDYDRKRWAGCVFASQAHGPWLLTKLRARKQEGTLYW